MPALSFYCLKAPKQLKLELAENIRWVIWARQSASSILNCFF